MTPFSTFLLESRRDAFMQDVEHHTNRWLARLGNQGLPSKASSRYLRIPHPEIPGGYLDFSRTNLDGNSRHVDFQYEPAVHGHPGHEQIPGLTANAIGHTLAHILTMQQHDPYRKFNIEPLTGSHHSLYAALINHINQSMSGPLSTLKGTIPERRSYDPFVISHRFPK